MVTVGKIYDAINEFAPFSEQMDFDNAGLLVGSKNDSVTKVLLALDITAETVKEAQQMGAELILSHHPVIFHPLKKLASNSVPYMLARSGIAAICAHTNLDFAKGGVNSCLADVLEIEEQENMFSENIPQGIVGNVKEERTPKEFAEHVKKKLGACSVVYTDGEKSIRRVAVCGGAGEDLLFEAIEAGADAFVTGESKHHLLLAAKEMGITMVIAGHYASEQVVLAPLCEKLGKQFPEIEFTVSKTEKEVIYSV